MPVDELFILKRNNIPWYYYDFSHKGKRFRGWVGAVSKITKRKAKARLFDIYATIVTTGENPVRQRLSSTPSVVFKDYKAYLKNHAPSTYESFRYLCHHLEKSFKGKTKITGKDIIAYQRKKLDEGLSKPTINRHLDYCRAAFYRAGVQPNPFANFTRFREKERIRYLTEDELKSLMDQANRSPNSQLPLIILTAILTGLRKSEILGLHQRHIDFGNQVITITVKGGSLNTVPLPDQLVLPFKRALKKNDSGYVFVAFQRKVDRFKVY
ncbi:tyrosine-type recombinase/integrase [Thermodesulfobacteriota bacterium]